MPMHAPGCGVPTTGRTIAWRCGVKQAAARPTCCTSGRHAPAPCFARVRCCPGLPDLPTTGVALDDADAVRDETALLHLLNAAGEACLPILLAARAPPSRWAVRLPDLASRLRAITAVELGPPEDTLLRALLARLLADRQLRPPEALLEWLLRRLPRSAGGVARGGRPTGCRSTRAAPQYHRAVRGPRAGGPAGVG